MEDKTENLERAFEYVRTFYNEIARMLSEIIRLMDNEGWETHPGGSITYDLSYSLASPNQWMFFYVYKNFTTKKADSLTKSVVIFFNEFMNDFPISIVCGKLDDPQGSFDKWWLYDLAVDNRDKLEGLIGEVCFLTREQNGKTLKGDVFAIPLSAITSQDDVKNKIVEKLLGL